MQSKCRACGKELEYPNQTHCSNQCLFAPIWNSKSIRGNPIEKWDDADPWT